MPSPIRQLYDRSYHASAMTGKPLPEPTPDDTVARGRHAVQVLRTYPARLRRYPFAPHGERSIAHAYLRALKRARTLIYLEDQYFWSRDVAEVFAQALRDNPDLHIVVVVPRYPDHEGRMAEAPALLGRQIAAGICREAAGDRFAMYDVENHVGTPVYVHAKVVIVDDVWAMIGSDNLNRRSWTHDSELSIGVLDEVCDTREPLDPAGLGDGARRFARDLRLGLLGEHLDRSADDVDDLIDPVGSFHAMARSAAALDAWHNEGRRGERPGGMLRKHQPARVGRTQRLLATPMYHLVYDPDGRSLRDRLRRRL